MSNIFVVKKSGEKELYSEEKVKRSMRRIGLPEELWPQVLRHIEEKLHENITTEEVFNHITEFLEKKDEKASIRFNLKQAIFDLGPTGFPFEKYMERIFKDLGYKTAIDQILEGDCVTHEIDILIEKNGKREVIEAKFHNQQGIKTDIHVLLYTYARFLEVKEKNQIDGVGVVTNTKLSEDAIRYSKCKGIRVIAWNYPEVGNLQDFVEHPNLYPVTILSALKNEEKQKLLDNNIILCSDLLVTPDHVLSGLAINHDRLEKAKAGARVMGSGLKN